MSGALTRTRTYTYTRTRTMALEVQFRLFLRYAQVPDAKAEMIADAVNARELQAVGAYLTDGGERVCEVELRIDWGKHDMRVEQTGNRIPDEIPGWSRGVAPEVELSIEYLARVAAETGKRIRTWIIVSDEVAEDPARHDEVCRRLGYTGGSVPPWKDGAPLTMEREASELDELKAVSREADF